MSAPVAADGGRMDVLVAAAQYRVPPASTPTPRRSPHAVPAKAPVADGRRWTYKCHRCGQPKKGHLCPAAPAPQPFRMQTVIGGVPPAPGSARDLEADIDTDNEDERALVVDDEEEAGQPPKKPRGRPRKELSRKAETSPAPTIEVASALPQLNALVPPLPAGPRLMVSTLTPSQGLVCCSAAPSTQIGSTSHPAAWRSFSAT
jgi:hypothetical protein